ncbi:MAG: Gfo/Idh/MocA family oxidoreductase [Candidatus Woesebacteria bacterium]|jgi:predicted dehydrogenase
MVKPVRFGVIGCGGHSASHIMPGVHAGLELVAVYDRSKRAMSAAVAPAVAASQNVRQCNSYDELLGMSEVQAVIVITGDADHPGHLWQAVQSGKHTLAEKPMAIDNDGLRLVKNAFAVAKHRGLIVSTCHPRRVSDPYMWPKNSLGWLVRTCGKLERVELMFDYPVPKKPGKHESLMVDHFSHEIDYLRWLLSGLAPNELPFAVSRKSDGADEYVADGVMGDVEFEFSGSRKNTSTKRVFAEYITLRFSNGWCKVSTVDGRVEIHGKGKSTTYASAGPTDYNKHFARLMAGFAAEISGQPTSYSISVRDMLVNTESTIRLAQHGSFTYAPAP